MESLVYQRCFNHAQREAVARCPECSQFFCRECITEHDDRVICTSCLWKFARRPLTERRGFAGAVRLGQALLGLCAAWFFFYLIGEALIKLPTSFHEGQLWQGDGADSE